MKLLSKNKLRPYLETALTEMGYTASSIHKAIEYFEEDFSHYKKFQQIIYQKILSQSLVNFTLDIKMDVLVPSKERVGFKKRIEDSYGILLPELVIDRNVFRTMLLLFLLGLSIEMVLVVFQFDPFMIPSDLSGFVVPITIIFSPLILAFIIPTQQPLQSYLPAPPKNLVLMTR